MRRFAGIGLTVVSFISLPIVTSSQGVSPQTRMVDVAGRPMRIQTAGIDRRAPGQPVIVLEAGAPDPTRGFSSLDTWKPLWAELIKLGPVVAYERRGTGQSAADSETPTLSRVARVLHDLLQSAQIAPPYVLV